MTRNYCNDLMKNQPYFFKRRPAKKVVPTLQ